MYFSFANLLLTRLYICQMLDVSYRLTIRNCIEDKYDIHRNKVTCCPLIWTLKEDKDDLSNSLHFFLIFAPLPLLATNFPFPNLFPNRRTSGTNFSPSEVSSDLLPTSFLLSSFFLSFLTSLQTKVPLTQISPPSLIPKNYPPIRSPSSLPLLSYWRWSWESIKEQSISY